LQEAIITAAASVLADLFVKPITKPVVKVLAPTAKPLCEDLPNYEGSAGFSSPVPGGTPDDPGLLFVISRYCFKGLDLSLLLLLGNDREKPRAKWWVHP